MTTSRRPASLDDRAWLESAYHAQGRSCPEIAAELGCNPTTVQDALKRLGIPTRTSGRKRAHVRLYDRAWLASRYECDHATTYEIAAELGCEQTSVLHALQRFSIESRPACRRPVRELKDTAGLEQLYVDDELSSTDIASTLNCSPSTVRRAMEAAGLERRTTGNALLADAAWLERRYHTDGAKLVEMAAEAGVTRPAVGQAMKRSGIARRPRGRSAGSETPELRDHEWLRRRYLDEAATIADIAKELDTSPSSVGRAMDQAGIVRRQQVPVPRKAPELDDEAWLRRRYWEDGVRLEQIAAEIGVTRTTLSRAMKRLGIPTHGRGRPKGS